MRSIRRYLLQALILSLIIGSLLITLLVYFNAAHEIDELYNENMQDMATLLKAQIEAAPLQQVAKISNPIAMLKGEEQMLIQVWKKQPSKLVYSSYPAIAMPLYTQTGKFTAQFQQQSWHLYRTETNGAIIQLAQPTRARQRFVREMAGHLLYPMLAQIPLIGLFIWLAVGKSLLPLARISHAIHRRSAASLAPLEASNIPREVKPMVQELNALLERLGAALTIQKQFTADAAHELRTPLAAIKLQLGNLERAKKGDDQQLALAKLHSGVDRATHVVQQLLVLARLEPESTHAAHTPVNLAPLASAAIEAHAEIAYARQIDLGLARSEEALVQGDTERLRIVIDNLIDNAIRYGHAGGKVDIAIYTTEDIATIEVKDNGPGIAPAEREHIFERFYRVMGTQANGTGLGLAIVKHIVEEHGGTITIAEGIDGAGVAFIVRLPSISL